MLSCGLDIEIVVAKIAASSTSPTTTLATALRLTVFSTESAEPGCMLPPTLATVDAAYLAAGRLPAFRYFDLNGKDRVFIPLTPEQDRAGQRAPYECLGRSGGLRDDQPLPFGGLGEALVVSEQNADLIANAEGGCEVECIQTAKASGAQ